jgi:hypothetical protein
MAKKCATCNGTCRCRECRGSGKFAYQGWGTPSDKPCAFCRGTGVCQVCQGKGER